ncbi:MAG: alkaline phosphatase [Bacteroidia bacterium]|nr:alkaline phosphatase [Bacteroidia bacterium]
MKKLFLNFFYLTLIAVLLSGCAGEEKSPKFVFLFIGDGMGLGQQQLTESYLGAYDSEYPMPELNFTGLPQKGFITTYSSSHKITDSAAAGTALSSGQKTSNGRIMKNSEATAGFTSVAAAAKSMGMQAGVISSVSLDHATPAVFYANADSRNAYYEISMQLPESGFDFFGGGGFRNPEGLQVNQKYSENYTRQDTRGVDAGDRKNMLLYAKEKGYTVITTADEFHALKKGMDKVIAINPQLQSGAAMPYAIDRPDGELALADFVRKGIELMENDNGFFMMVEGGKIDWACHANDAATTVHEVIDFDQAVKEAIDFYLLHPDETLIIVTGDHETGGLAMGNTVTYSQDVFRVLSHQKASLEVVENYMESLDHPDFSLVMEALGKFYGLGTDIPLNGFDSLRIRYALHSSAGIPVRQNKIPDEFLDYGGYDPVAITATRIMSEKAGVAWTSWSHTSIPLPVHSIGMGSERFGGFYDNTDIPKRIMELIGYTAINK